ncbi:hypothetical protein Sme01_36700 [Sphaerisporangium melleum]|uniref:Secreted protein n=1 Tax=Sphaerisporangium melleum TaxID=321316 RepID=A0A917RP96_9ACTN|nr:hypothetical protein [Sphaerisporangium melleum]GGL16631.1 hypothetical protein GCM10007964_68250 [Sphaerisporangium melleum]GII71194.1 hypothetical protein Sme01_36700 [Sphaerisporangium melleum]
MKQLSLRPRLRLVLAALAVAGAALVPAATASAQAPLLWHAGWFVKNMCYKDARSFASSALNNNGYRTAYTPPNAVVGSNGSTIVEVSYAPAQTSYSPAKFSKIYFTVTATSNVSSSAETARNKVRQSIVNMTYIDYC